MRLLLHAPLGPGTVERLRALSPDLEVVDASADPGFDLDRLTDPNLEVIVGMRAPRDLARVPRLRWLQIVFAGLDHLDDDPPWRQGLTVTNAKGVYAIPMAEYVTSMVLRIHQPIATWTADQGARHWPPSDERPTAQVVRGRTAVIVGYGSIGREVARQLAALGMRIVAVKPRPDARADDAFRVPGSGDPDGSIPDRIVGLDELDTALGAADVVILTLPLTPASRAIVDRRRLAAIAPGAWLINVSRGGLIDEPALIEALREGRLAGAVLDVATREPLPPDNPLWAAPNVIITPHVSGPRVPYLDDLVVENVRRDLAGEPLLNRIDPERGY